MQGFSDDLVDEQEPEAHHLEVQRVRGIRTMPVREDVRAKFTSYPTNTWVRSAFFWQKPVKVLQQRQPEPSD